MESLPASAATRQFHASRCRARQSYVLVALTCFDLDQGDAPAPYLASPAFDEQAIARRIMAEDLQVGLRRKTSVAHTGGQVVVSHELRSGRKE